ncbi:MAG: hypothetical protein HC777_02420 [Hyphomonadaceae bacterium]|nr:hypothetical protein [Hyphomonadaceae bacterium]
MDVNTDSESDLIEATRRAFLDGDYVLDLSLGLTARASHHERGERDCLNLALPVLKEKLGPAASVIDGGHFSGAHTGLILQALERPKAGIILSPMAQDRGRHRAIDLITTAQMQTISYDIIDPEWPLETLGSGANLVTILSGGFGLLSRERALMRLITPAQFCRVVILCC